MIRDKILANNSNITEIKGLSESDAVNFLPDGWHKFIEIIFDAARVCEIKIHMLDIKNGTLYVTGEGVYDSIFKRISRTIMIDSALTCMVCGKYGLRRKNEIGSPPLCGPHYLDYINEV
jgi:hypothetical protein